MNLDFPNLPMRVVNHPKRLEPGVFGIFRPVLLLPEGITERLSAAELQSMIALAKSGIAQLVLKQREVLAPLLTRVDGMARDRLNRKFR